MFKNKLYNLLKDLNKMKTKQDTLQRCVQDKLNFSFDMYQSEVMKTCEYLLSRSAYKVMKNIAREQQKGEL